MPLYEYQCDRDGRFEVIRKFSDPPLKKCPTCGRPVQRLPSAPAIQFKGTGWYVTDYAKKGSGESGSKAGKAKSEEAKSGESKSSESKSSEGKSETKSAKDASTPAATPSKKSSD